MKSKLTIAVLILQLTACSGLQVSGRDLGKVIEQENRAVVVFSVDNRTPLRFHSLSFARAGDDATAAEIGTVPIDPRKGNVQVFAVLLPTGATRVGLTRMRAGNLWYEIDDTGLVFTTGSGEINYLGRLVISSMLVGKYEDSGRKYIHSVKLDFGEQLESDRALIAKRYDLPVDAPMIHANLDMGVEEEYLVLQPWIRPGRGWPDGYRATGSWTHGGFSAVGPELPRQRQTETQN